MTRISIAVLSFFLFAAQISKAQNTSPWLNQLTDSIRQETNVPALACAVVSSDTVFYGISGTVAIDESLEVSLLSAFHIGSNSKAITSYIAFRLIQEGKISLDTRLFSLIDDVKKRKWRYRKVTLGKLLSHQARIRSYTSGDDFVDVPKWIYELSPSGQRLGFAAHELRQKPLKKGVHYSNAGYALASLMLERASGESYEALVEKYMGEFGVSVLYGFPVRQDSTAPKGHIMIGDSLVAQGADDPYKLPAFMLAAGDMSMNIVEYSRFVQENLRGVSGQSNSLPASAYQQLHYGISNYAYGWGNRINGSDSMSYHDGSAGTFYTHCVVSKSRGQALIIFTNSGVTNQAHIKLRNAILQELRK